MNLTIHYFFLPFVKPIKVFDEKYFEFNSQNKEIVFFWTKVSCQKEYTKLTPYVENF
ncbi:Uncharacterised protein [Streptococcus acidominimus]|uniref:Uncharacterized protein n=1 Tax=Streptococcus acidominimus TaxID=1326 RepID=A0A239X2L2_STRAI|nr:Uncharacterised protein [Streptococcus acidominimus]